ncbi:alpha/beta hydrolase [Nocardia transvalensis]|uniref:alpha/beta hydrolase n=1 Tax=Nocardia transvalensis TaxID=37333 RepID=UPI003A5D16CE
MASAAVAGIVVALLAAVGASTASAAPIGRIGSDAVAADGSRITGVEHIDARNVRLQVYSAAMDETFPVEIQLPADRSQPRPSLYLLNGAGGGMDAASWKEQTHALEFLSDKNVNVIMPIGGKLSYYTDWIKDDPVLGRNKWKTYLTEELPPLIDAALGANGVNAIAGLSTSATSVLALPIAKPGLYKAAAAYSGCAQTSDPIGSQFVRAVVNQWGKGSVENMWGPVGSPEWEANDPYVQAEKLRGVELYISSGNGMPGKHDVMNDPYIIPGPRGGLERQIIVGGAIEAATHYCSQNMRDKLAELGIPATFNFTAGTHSWGYWEDNLKHSWPVLARGLGL